MLKNMDWKEEGKLTSLSMISGFLMALSLNLFLIPGDIFASGFAGVAQILNVFIPLSPGILLFLLNIPVAILGWRLVGKRFTYYSFVTVAFTTLFLEVLPIRVLSEDIILNAVFGGVIGGTGAGIILKWGASMGGLDIIALIMAKRSDRPVGMYFFILNAIIVTSASFIFGLEEALYTLLALYVLSRIIDTIHTRHVKLTAMIVTDKADDLQEAFHAKVTRGVTRIPAKGGYTKADKEVMMIVITRYELYLLQQVIEEVDPHAFTNIVQTTGIFGLFRKDD